LQAKSSSNRLNVIFLTREFPKANVVSAKTEVQLTLSCARQIQEKCIEQNKDLYVLFVDLTKAFETVPRPGLYWRPIFKNNVYPS
jgi:hypothetical protein